MSSSTGNFAGTSNSYGGNSGSRRPAPSTSTPIEPPAKRRRLKTTAERQLRLGFPPYPVEEYIARGSEISLLDARRFESVEDYTTENGSRPDSRFINNRHALTRVGAWKERWRHWSNDPKTLSSPTGVYDTFWHRSHEEEVYHQRMVPVILDIVNGKLIRDEAADVTLHLTDLPFHDWEMYYPDSARAWARDFSFEARLRRDPESFQSLARRGRAAPVFAGWHNVEVFYTPSSKRSELYVPVPSWFLSTWQASPVLSVPSPWVTQHFAHVFLSKTLTDSARYTLWRYACAEFAMFTLVRFLHFARYPVDYNELNEPGLKGRTVLAPLQPEVVHVIDTWDLLRILAFSGEGFDRALALLAYRRTKEIQWDFYGRVIGATGPYLYYDYETGDVSPVPPRTRTFEKTVGRGLRPKKVVDTMEMPEIAVKYREGVTLTTLDACRQAVRDYDIAHAPRPPTPDPSPRPNPTEVIILDEDDEDLGDALDEQMKGQTVSYLVGRVNELLIAKDEEAVKTGDDLITLVGRLVDDAKEKVQIDAEKTAELIVQRDAANRESESLAVKLKEAEDKAAQAILEVDVTASARDTALSAKLEYSEQVNRLTTELSELKEAHASASAKMVEEKSKLEEALSEAQTDVAGQVASAIAAEEESARLELKKALANERRLARNRLRKAVDEERVANEAAVNEAQASAVARLREVNRLQDESAGHVQEIARLRKRVGDLEDTLAVLGTKVVEVEEYRDATVKLLNGVSDILDQAQGSVTSARAAFDKRAGGDAPGDEAES